MLRLLYRNNCLALLNNIHHTLNGRPHLVKSNRMFLNTCSKRLSSSKRRLQQPETVFRSIHVKLSKLEASFCTECNQPFASEGLSARAPRHKHLCIGCSRLFGPYKHDSLMKQSMKLLLAQEPHHLLPTVSNTAANCFSPLRHRLRAMSNSVTAATNNHISQLHERLVPDYTEDLDEETIKARRASRFKATTMQRYGITGSDNDVPSKEEIYDLIVRSNGKCAISNVQGVWASDFYKYWSPSSTASSASASMAMKTLSCPPPHPSLLTFDHITPKSRGGSCHISNVQIILSCLNQVKGPDSNDELSLWLDKFRSSLRI